MVRSRSWEQNFLKRKPDTPKLHFLFANLICDSKYMYYCNVKTNIYNFCKGVSVVISFIVLKVCFESAKSQGH